MTTTLPTPAASAGGSTGYEQLTGTYAIDPQHSRLGFVARHAMVTKVRGRFHEFEGVTHIDGTDPSRSSAQLRIAVASIDTHLAVRDEHLRSNDFLGAQEHPYITFDTTGIEEVEPARFRVTGDLTIKGITRPVTFDLEYTGAATDADGVPRIGFEGSTTIDRRDWGVSWNAALETGGVLVSDAVRLEIDVSAIRVG